jgi:succinoglycan biosynthesis transport protein ExoP
MTPDLHFQQLADILRRRKGLILAMAALGATLASIGGLLIPPKYTAKAQIEVESPLPLFVAGQVAAPQADESTIQTGEAGLSSSDHLRRVLDSLLQDPDFTATADNMHARSRPGVDDLWRRLSALLSPSVPGPAEPTIAGEATLSLHDLERHLTVQQERGSRVISVRFTAASPEAAALVANRTAELYVKGREEEKRARAEHGLTLVGEQISNLKDELQRADEALGKYRTAHGLSGTERIETVDQQLADVNRQLDAAESDLAGRLARLAHVRELRRRAGGTEALVEALGTPTLIELRRQELALLQSEAQLAVTTGEGHPKMQELRGQLEEIRAKIAREVGGAADNLESQVQILGAQMRPLRERIAAVQAAGADVHLRELEREAADRRQVYLGLLQRQTELRGQQGGLAPEVRVLSLAAPPDQPSSPSPILFVFPALIAFAIAGGMLAVAMDRLDQGLRSERDVSDALGLPCIGIVPQLGRMGRTRPHRRLFTEPFAAYTEAIRSLVAALQLADRRSAPKAILIGSSVPREGKTTLAVSVAVYAALLGRRVLLIDLDFRNPAVLRELGGEARGGVLDLLLEDRLSEDVVQRVPGLQLDYLPACRRPVDPLPLFADERMPRLLRQLRESYDCVVIDSPPLLSVTEARLLAAMVDKVVFVVKWGSTRRDDAQNALNLLRNSGLPGNDRVALAGVVVTQADPKKHARYRYYGDIGDSVVPHHTARVGTVVRRDATLFRDDHEHGG